MTWEKNDVGAWLRTPTGHQFELRPNRSYVFGRGPECDLRVDDPACSRRHARLTVAGDVRRLYLEDLGSKNGTYRNGDPVRARTQLASGDRIQIGAIEHVVVINDGALEMQLDTRTRLG